MQQVLDPPFLLVKLSHSANVQQILTTASNFFLAYGRGWFLGPLIL